MMSNFEPQESPERDLTDASLREEREKADREMIASRKATEKHAEAVVEHARENADAVLVASLFHFGEFTVSQAKHAMQDAGINVRMVESEHVTTS